MSKLSDKNITDMLHFCKTVKTTTEICDLIQVTNDYLNNVMRAMVRDGYFNYSRVPFRGQYKNGYTTTLEAFNINNARLAKIEAKRLQEMEELAKIKVKPVKKESYYSHPEPHITVAKERHTASHKRRIKHAVGMGKMAYC